MMRFLRLSARRSAFASLAAAIVLTAPVTSLADRGGHTLFITSAVENPDDTVSLPLYRGTSQGRTVWYIVLDSSDGKDAVARGVNHAPKLNNARGTRAVQPVSVVNGTIDFPKTVDFSGARQVVPGPQGFPPLVAKPGAIGEEAAPGEPSYSPLIELPDGTILNAPHIANDTGQAAKAVQLDFARGTAIYHETNGFQGGKAVKYVSTDASDPVAAALEDVTYAPALDDAPAAGADGTDVARASLAAFVNGQTGVRNPQRQGLNSALMDGLDPLNVLRWNPSQGRYSPLWDVHLAEWSAQALATGQNLRQRDFNRIRNLAQKGLVTGPGGAAFGPSGFIVNCPIVSSD